jgi:hypothetical protein
MSPFSSILTHDSALSGVVAVGAGVGTGVGAGAGVGFGVCAGAASTRGISISGSSIPPSGRIVSAGRWDGVGAGVALTTDAVPGLGVAVTRGVVTGAAGWGM